MHFLQVERKTLAEDRHNSFYYRVQERYSAHTVMQLTLHCHCPSQPGALLRTQRIAGYLKGVYLRVLRSLPAHRNKDIGVRS